MITEDEILAYGEGAEKIMYGVERRIMADIVRRIKKTNGITSTADYQLNQLVEMGYSSGDIKKALANALGESEEYVDNLYDKVAKEEYIRNEDLYKAQGIDFVPFEDNAVIQNILVGAINQTAGTLNNLSQSMGFVVGKDFVSLTDYYQKLMSNVIMDVATGGFDYNSTLKKAVKEMTNSGVRWIDYESGWHNRITVSARRSVMTGLSQLTQGITEYNAKQLNTDTYEVSAHGGARPSHADWQGKVYTYDELVSVCGLGEVTGLLGANCYHTYYPYIEGVSKRAYTDEQLEEYKRNDVYEYQGEMISEYDARQIMRRKETQMRAQREKVYYMKQGKADKNSIMQERAKYRTQMYNYKEIAEKFGLHTEMERVYIDGLGRV